MIRPRDPSPAPPGSDPNDRSGKGEPISVIAISRPAPDVHTEPVTVLSGWCVWDCQGSHHITGLTPGGSWRTSTPIVAWDPGSGTARTHSGRRYVLSPSDAGSTSAILSASAALGADGPASNVTAAYLPSEASESDQEGSP